MNKDENKMIKDIMAVIVRHHSGLGCDVLCDGDQCENCYFTAKDLYYAGYRKVSEYTLDLITKQEKEIDFQVKDRARLQKELDELEMAYFQRAEELDYTIRKLEQSKQETVKGVLLQVKHDFVEHPGLTIHQILDRIADKYDIDWDGIHEHNI